MDGSDAALNEALAQAAVAAGEVSMAEPTPIEGKQASGPDLRLVDVAAPTEGVTSSEPEATVPFEEAFLAEQLGTEVEPDEEGEPVLDDTGAPLTREQILDQREAELNRREEEAAINAQIEQNNQFWTDKYAEGQQWANGLLAEVERYGAQQGKSDYEIERAKNVAILNTINPWFDEYWQAREVGIVEPYKAAQGRDAISVLIAENGLRAEDRQELLRHIANPEVMRTVAEVMGAERARIAERDGKIKQKATRNVARRMTENQIAAQSPSSGRRPPTVVKGSDAELDFMVKNRPTLRRAG